MPKYAKGLLERAPTVAIASIGETLLDDAMAARVRLQERADDEALHDFRVSLRRLRSVLRAFRPYVEHCVTRKLRRRMRALARTTNDARDAEVQVHWIEARRQRISPTQQVGVKWFRSRVEQQRDEAYLIGLEAIEHVFPRLDRRVRDALSAAAADPFGGTGTAVTFAAALGALLQQHEATLFHEMSGIRQPGDEGTVHTTRISAKRLRYLLELIAGERAPAKRGVARLKDLQDILGDLHDAQVVGVEFAAACELAAAEHARRLSGLDEGAQQDDGERRKLRRRNATPGMLQLVRLCREAHEELFARLEGWRKEQATQLSNDVRSLVEEFDAFGPLPTEIERKYLLKSLPPAVQGAAAVDVDQGWLPGTRLVERIRRVAGADGDRYFRTVKLGEGITRIEVEEEATPEVFEALWPLTEGRRVRKRRYYVPDGELRWEIDEFLDRELALAEIELPRADTPVSLPAWLQDVVEREVTGDPEYVNVNLAR
jgi:CHAD domain-containing protein/CYTH domain-containing protein